MPPVPGARAATAISMPAKPAAEPTDRSNWPAIRSSVAGQAMMPTTATFWRMLIRFSLFRKNFEAIEKYDEQRHEDDDERRGLGDGQAAARGRGRRRRPLSAAASPVRADAAAGTGTGGSSLVTSVNLLMLQQARGRDGGAGELGRRPCPWPSRRPDRRPGPPPRSPTC